MKLIFDFTLSPCAFFFLAIPMLLIAAGIKLTSTGPDAPSLQALQGFWWSKLESRLFVLSELPKIVYYWTWHGLIGKDKDPKWAKELDRVYMAIIQKVFIRRVSSEKGGRLLPV